MDEPSAVFVGIDVSKDRLDVHLRPTGEAFCVPRDAKGLDSLTGRLNDLPVALVVLEATGGFEATVAAALAGAGCRSASSTRARSVTLPGQWAASLVTACGSECRRKSKTMKIASAWCRLQSRNLFTTVTK